MNESTGHTPMRSDIAAHYALPEGPGPAILK